MTRLITPLCCALVFLLIGCSSGSPRRERASVFASLPPTSGGDGAAAGNSATRDSATVVSEAHAPVVLRTTIPVPVPQPAVARDDLSAPLQAVWTYIEEQVTLGRPEGPEESTVANVQAWANGPFQAWLVLRRDALTETRDLLEAIAQEPVYERALALALWAYAFEDLGAQVTGAPVPDEIATDDELLGIYIESLNEASVPLGQRAMELYADCRQRLASLGDESEWLPWRAYCVQRGLEIIEGYGLTAPPTEDPLEPE